MNRPIALRAQSIDNFKLGSGLRVIYFHTPTDPISACQLFLPAGTATEKPDVSGVTSLMSGLLTKGTLKKSARQIAEEVEGMGGSLGAGAGHDFFNMSTQAASEYFVQMLEILSEVTFDSIFPTSEFEKEKTAHLAGIESKKESIFTVTHELLSHHLFGNHPYARPTSGEKDTVMGLTETDVRVRHQNMLSPAGSLLSIASSLSREELEPHLNRLFGRDRWSISGLHNDFPLASVLPLSKSEEIRNESPFEQAYLMMGFAAPDVSSDDYATLKVLNGILGGGMSSRLFQNLREKKALAYDVGSFYPSRKGDADFVIYIGLKPERVQEAKVDILQEIQHIQKNSISADELLHTIRHLQGSYILDHQTNGQRSHYLGWWDMLGCGADYDKRYIEALDKVTGEEVHTAARTYLSQPSVTVITVPTVREHE